MFKRSLFAVLWLALAVPATSQSTRELGLPFITTYTSRDLGANANGWAIIEDNRGVIYVGLQEGLAEFDGQSWTFLETEDQDFFRAFAVGRDGVVYAGTVGNLGYLAPDSLGRTKFVSMLDQVPEEHRDFDDVWHIFARDDGIFFYTARSIIQWTGSRMRVWEGEFHVGAMVHDELYIREWGTGIKRLEGDSLLVVPGGEAFADERVYVMIEYDDTRMLVGTRTMGMFLYDGETFEPFVTEADGFLRDNQIYLPGLRLTDGTFVINTLAGGAVQIDKDGRIIRILNRSTGLPDNTVTSVYQDRRGDLWLALNNGITRVEIESPFTIFDERLGITSGVNSFARQEGLLYAGTIGGVFRLDPTSSRFSMVQGPVTPSLDLLSTHDVLVSAAMTSGVAQVRRGFTSIVKDAFGNEFIGNTVRRANADTNLVFIGLRTGLGVLYYQGLGRWIDLGSTSDFGAVLGMVVAPDDAIWTAGGFGVARVTIPWEEGRINVAGAVIDRYGPDRGLPGAPVFDVEILDGDVLVIGDDRVFRYDQATDKFVADPGFPDVRIRGGSVITKTPDEDIVYANFGLQTYIGKRQSDGSYDWDSTPFLRFHEDFVGAVMVDLDGVAWLAMSNGVVRYDSEVETSTDSPVYPTLIRSVVV